MTIVTFQYAVRTDRGGRERQEDAYAVRCLQRVRPAGGDGEQRLQQSELLAVLADGMGGHTGGALASRTSCSSFMDTYLSIDGGHSERLVHALDASNKAVAALIRNDQRLRGMGSTLLAISLEADGLRWISVGDSLLYLYRNKKLLRLNEDHSLAPILDELVEQGEISSDEANHHPKRGMLRSAVTGEEIKLVDLNDDVLTLSAGDWLILASDGLLTLKEDKIAKILEKERSNGADSVTEALIEAVKKVADPQQDNTTVLTVGFEIFH